MLTFAPGELTKTVTVRAVADRRREPNETFFVNLSQSGSTPINAVLIDAQGRGTIVNDD